MKKLLACAALCLSGCVSAPVENLSTRAQLIESTLPPMKNFGAASPQRPAMSNANIAADFLDLHFRLESGRELPVFTRFEGPITVRVTGALSPNLLPDLRALLVRMQREAGVDISLTSAAEANVTIEAVSRDDIRRALPHAACFVVPNVSSLAEFKRNRRKSTTNWALLRERNRLGIFLPSDSSPQEVRDCLHEELAQAIGPLNDLYRLPQSVFNDDNVHTVLTGFDMLILKASYAPELRTGMSRDEVAARLPAILDRLNPAGRGVPVAPISETPRSWINDVQTALGPGSTVAARQRSARAALDTAKAMGWEDHRRAFSHYMVGRMSQFSDPDTAKKHFDTALYYLRRTPGTELHRAYITTQTSAHALKVGRGDAALQQIAPSLKVAARSQNAALLSTLMLLQAKALEMTGRVEAARSVRLDSLGWARYGFGADWAVRAKLSEISALGPQGGGNGGS